MIEVTALKNGLMVIVEAMPHIESAAYTLLLPGGLITDPATRVGASLVLAELTTKGAGPYDSRELLSQFEEHGIRHGEGGGFDRFSYAGSLLADKLPHAFRLTGIMVREPKLNEDGIDSIRSILLQDIQSINDNPGRRVMVELGRRFSPAPFNRPSCGDADGIENVSGAELREQWSAFYRPGRAILSVAGRVDPVQVLRYAEEAFSSWEGSPPALPAFPGFLHPRREHIESDSAQVQIVGAAPSAKFGDPLYYAGKVVLHVLSGGMFGRLFIEVREKRGLVYSVFARHSATAEYGTVIAYAGTTPDRAQETLDVMRSEFARLKGSVTPDELKRAKANIKSALVIGEESAGSRASSNSIDWWLMKRIRSLEEITQEIDKVSLSDIDAFLDVYPLEPQYLLTLGSHALKVE